MHTHVHIYEMRITKEEVMSLGESRRNTGRVGGRRRGGNNVKKNCSCRQFSKTLIRKAKRFLGAYT